MASEVFVVRSPLTINNSIIFGRNSFSFCCKEIVYSAKEDGSLAYILNGTCGANEKNVSISMIFAENKPENGLSALDLTKLILKEAENAESAVNVIAKLVDQNEQAEELAASPKYSFFICDNNDAFVVDIIGKLWAAEKVEESSFRVFSGGFSVKTKIDKQSEGLEDKLKDLGLYDGSSELNFSEAVSMVVSDRKWPCDDPTDGFSAEQMFEVLRASAVDKDISSSFVSILKDSVSVHWFTGTPNPKESVFKPFIFTPNARISPLTAVVRENEDETLLRQLHDKKNWEQVGELLKSLEKSCVNEIDGYADNVPIAELDDLMKDCVEAEVKFYR